MFTTCGDLRALVDLTRIKLFPSTQLQHYSIRIRFMAALGLHIISDLVAVLYSIATMVHFETYNVGVFQNSIVILYLREE